MSIFHNCFWQNVTGMLQLRGLGHFKSVGAPRRCRYWWSPSTLVIIGHQHWMVIIQVWAMALEFSTTSVPNHWRKSLKHIIWPIQVSSLSIPRVHSWNQMLFQDYDNMSWKESSRNGVGLKSFIIKLCQGKILCIFQCNVDTWYLVKAQ